MLIGFGCTVPAYMSSRILETREDRLVTMHVNTFMSCGARLPVYIMVCGAFWPDKAGNVIFSLYFLGIIIAVLTAKLLRSTRFKGMSAPFVIELPPYRLPTLRGVLIHMWTRSWLYLKKAGTVILGITIIMWFLMSFPKPEKYDRDYGQLIGQAKEEMSKGEIRPEEYLNKISLFKSQMAYENLIYSYAGRIGKGLEPVLRPLGFDWKLGIGVFAGIAAKEAIVSTIGTVYNINDADEKSRSLREKLRNDPDYSPLIAYAFLVFILLYIPCTPAIIVFLAETGSFKETMFQISYTLIVAWVMAFIVYRGGMLLGLG
jgi:ferrous iron transport protein B